LSRVLIDFSAKVCLAALGKPGWNASQAAYFVSIHDVKWLIPRFER
jgi:hypothetical protein